MLSPTFSSSVHNKTFFFFPAFHLSSSLFLRVSLPSVVVGVVAEFQFGKKGKQEGKLVFCQARNGGEKAIFSLIAHSGYASMSHTFFASSNLSGTLNPMSSQRSVLRPFLVVHVFLPLFRFFFHYHLAAQTDKN